MLQDELKNSYNILTEAVQTILRKNKIENAYELLKELSRGKDLTKKELHNFINKLSINEKDREILLSLEPKDYIGLSTTIVDKN